MPESLKFYTDKHIPKQVAIQLRARGVEVVRCEEVGLGDAKDPEHLEYASEHGLAVVTHDDDFLALHAKWQTEAKHHTGIMFFHPYMQGDIGGMVTQLGEFYEIIEGEAGTLEKDIWNQTQYIGRKP